MIFVIFDNGLKFLWNGAKQKSQIDINQDFGWRDFGPFRRFFIKWGNCGYLADVFFIGSGDYFDKYHIETFDGDFNNSDNLDFIGSISISNQRACHIDGSRTCSRIQGGEFLVGFRFLDRIEFNQRSLWKYP